MTFTADLVRVYYNRGEDPTKAWSVDCGLGSVEFQCTMVTLEGVVAISALSDRIEASILAPSVAENTPRAWLEIKDAEVVCSAGYICIRPKEKA